MAKNIIIVSGYPQHPKAGQNTQHTTLGCTTKFIQGPKIGQKSKKKRQKTQTTHTRLFFKLERLEWSLSLSHSLSLSLYLTLSLSTKPISLERFDFRQNIFFSIGNCKKKVSPFSGENA